MKDGNQRRKRLRQKTKMQCTAEQTLSGDASYICRELPHYVITKEMIEQTLKTLKALKNLDILVQ
jgi:hypothetical protein